ncbi:hypothetical protein T261_0008 [Streptomyces lydicus]|nr:hypothetical protein T261_0008 [Streptomyces lydicus]
MSSADLTPHQPFDERDLRAADTDREAVAERLREATGEGRLSLEELVERLETAFTAKTFGDLEPLLADLPDPAPVAGRPDQPLVLKVGSGALQQAGYWVVPSRITADTGMGSIKIDFTAAECGQREVTVEVAIGMGTVIVVVPRGWEVHTHQVTVGTGNVVNRVKDRPEPNGTVVRFTGHVRTGSLKVRHPSRFELARARRADR